MKLFCVWLRRDDEGGTVDAKVLVQAENNDAASEAALEFARSTLFFGAKAEYVEWMQTSGVETPYVISVEAPRPKIKPKKLAKHK
jgi:hypothetical protein